MLKCLAGALVLVAAYVCGYVMGQTAQLRADTKSHIVLTLRGYTLAQMGLQDGVKDQLAFLLYGDTVAYQALQRNRFHNYFAWIFAGEPRGESWERKFQDAKAFADGYKTNVVALDKQKFIDELNAQHRSESTGAK